MAYEDILVPYYTYTTLQGDTWDAIAIDFYGNPNLSYVLLSANPSYSDSVILDGGTKIKIPIIPEYVSPSTLPPWKVGG